MSDPLRVISVLPHLLSTYADGGNVVVLARRLQWRGIAVEVVETTAEDPLPGEGDLYVLGGGEDRAQLRALTLLQRCSSAVLSSGVPVLAVCAGIQLLGRSLPGDTGLVAGLDVLPLVTTRLDVRAVGEVTAQCEAMPGVGVLTGFVNHGGRTVLDDGVAALGRVLTGPGNAGADDRCEGIVLGGVVGTYLHGPVLARNPALADALLARALGRPLAPLPPGPPEALHAERLAASR